MNNLVLVFISRETGKESTEAYQGRIQEPACDLPVSGHHAQIAEEIQLGSGGRRTPLGGIDLRAHLLQEVVPVLVLEKQQLLGCRGRKAVRVCMMRKKIAKILCEKSKAE